MINLYLGSMDLRVIAVVQQTIAGRRLARPCRLMMGSRAKLSQSAVAIAHELWILKPQHAELLVFKTREEFAAAGATRPGGWIDLEHGEIIERLAANARTLGIEVQNLDKVRARAQAAVEKVDQQVDALRRSGGLGDLNAAYKTYRQECEANGTRAVSYNTWLERFTSHMLEQLAAEA